MRNFFSTIWYVGLLNENIPSILIHVAIEHRLTAANLDVFCNNIEFDDAKKSQGTEISLKCATLNVVEINIEKVLVLTDVFMCFEYWLHKCKN